MHYDLPLDRLREYRPDLAEPADLDGFWATTLEGLQPDPSFTRVDSGLVAVETYDVTLAGWAGDPVRAWLHLPAAPLRDGPLAGVVQYQGYNGGRGLPGENVLWALAGYVHVFMDTRGQGSGWGTGGATPDPHGSGPATAGFMTRGIHDPAEQRISCEHLEARARRLDFVIGAYAGQRTERHRDRKAVFEADDLTRQRFARPLHVNHVAHAHAGQRALQ